MWRGYLTTKRADITETKIISEQQHDVGLGFVGVSSDCFRSAGVCLFRVCGSCVCIGQ